MRDHREVAKTDGHAREYMVEIEQHRTKVKRAPQSKKAKKIAKISRRRNRK